MSRARSRAITVLTGERQAGKTSLCARIADLARAKSVTIAGVISPAIFRDGYKQGINVVDLRSGAARRLAARRTETLPGELAYRFDEAALSWANRAIATATPCDLLIIDEIGPLEILGNRGFIAAFDVLETGEYNLALVVVRPELIETFRTRLGLPFTVKRVEHFTEDILAGWEIVVKVLTMPGST